ncbi:MAG TPA: hypothetical protein VF690_06135 [Hymenobacter sp.]|jgi:hypothetical protein
MKKQTNLFIASALITCAAFGSLSSCSKREMEVASDGIAIVADVKSVDGRLVFKDFEVFKQTIDKLKTKSDAELLEWEQSLKFTSLRSSSGEGQEKLKAEFRFPGAYAAIINSQGEYKIGDKLYWYHAGKKHQFDSVADLEAVQKGRDVPHVTLAAGYKVVDTKTERASTTKSAARLGHNNSSGSDARYQYQFNLWNDAGSVRKIVYETHIYTELNSYNYQYHSILVMDLKLEYKGGNGSWRNAGDLRTVDAQFSGVASAYTSSTQAQLKSGPISVSLNRQSNSEASLWLMDCYAFSANVYNTTDIYWNYTINGRISSWVGSDTGHTYTVQGNDLW